MRGGTDEAHRRRCRRTGGSRKCVHERTSTSASTCVATPQQQIACRPQGTTDRGEISGIPVNIGKRKRAAAEAELTGAAMDDDVDRIEAFAAAQRVRDLLGSGTCATEKDRLNARPQPCDKYGNVGD
ncbi:hypothetical protein A8146_25985 [Mesorhizobium loti]|nr:hypothetical protein A8146_25985 [Mesorhizobium loti]